MAARSRRTLAALLALVVAAGSAACDGGRPTPDGSQPASSSARPSAAPASAQDVKATARDGVRDGGELRVAVDELPTSWNPLSAQGTGTAADEVRAPMTPRLFDVAPDGSLSANPAWLAEEPTVEHSPVTVVTYSLNPKAVWNDGTPFTVADFQATWRACNGSDAAIRCATTAGFDQVTAVEPGATATQVRVTYRTVYPDWRATFSNGPLRAESVATAATFDDGWTSLADRDGWFSGPYRIASYDPVSKTVVYVPNPLWWGAAPRLERVTFRALSSDDASRAYAAGELDAFRIGVDGDAYARAKTVADGEVRRAPGTVWRGLVLNQRSGVLADPAVRQAVVMALDRAEVARSDLPGMGLTPLVLGSPTLLTNQRGYTDLATVTGLRHDPDQARRTLEAAGWVAAADGTRAKDGVPLTVRFTVGDTDKLMQNQALQVRRQLARVGITVVVETVPQADVDTQVQQRTYELAGLAPPGSVFPYQALRHRVAENLSGGADADLDRLVATLATETDETRRAAAALEADRLLWADVRVLPLYQEPEQVGVRTRLANYGARGLGTLAWEQVGWLR